MPREVTGDARTRKHKILVIADAQACCSLNCLKGLIIGGYIGEYWRVSKRSVDNGTCGNALSKFSDYYNKCMTSNSSNNSTTMGPSYALHTLTGPNKAS